MVKTNVTLIKKYLTQTSTLLRSLNGYPQNKSLSLCIFIACRRVVRHIADRWRARLRSRKITCHTIAAVLPRCNKRHGLNLHFQIFKK